MRCHRYGCDFPEGVCSRRQGLRVVGCGGCRQEDREPAGEPSGFALARDRGAEATRRRYRMPGATLALCRGG